MIAHADDGQLNALLDGELSAEETRAVQAHLAGCAECARRLEEARAFLAEAGELLTVLSPGSTAPSVTSVTSVTSEPPLVAPLARGPAPSDSTRKSGATAQPAVAKTSKEIAVSIDGRTAMTPAIRPVPRPEAPAQPPRPARRWQVPELEKLAWAASLILCLSVGYLANEVKNLRQDQNERLALAAPDTSRIDRAPEEPARAAEFRTPPTVAPTGSRSGALRDGAAQASGTARTPARNAGRPVATVRKPPTPVSKPAPGFARQDEGIGNDPRSALGGAGMTSGGGRQRAADSLARTPAAAAEMAPPQPGRLAPTVAAPPAPGAATPRALNRPAAQAPGDAAGPPVNALEDMGVTTPLPPLTAFRRITLDEAVRRLSGSIRLVDGMVPARVEAGPGRMVEGADESRDVVRVTYLLSPTSRLVLDQQLGDQRMGSFNGIIQGDTLVTTSESGSTRIRWVDRKFWLSLSAVAPADSVRTLVARIR